MKSYVKDPQGLVDYVFDWSLWLGATDTITLSTWVVEITLVKETESNTPTTTTIFISGGTVGKDHTLTNSITTLGGRKTDRTIIIRIRDK